MSLDVSLIGENKKVSCCCRCCGNEHEKEEREEFYSANITHNLNKMAEAAGIYEYLWRPEEINIRKAADLIQPLEKGLNLLKSDPEKFKKYNASNGWGLYEHFIPFVENYLKACKINPDAKVEISR